MSAHDPAILHFSPLESARFGLRVYRGSVDSVDAQALRSDIERERIDVAILRLPAAALGGVSALARCGLEPIVADTLVSYDIDLAERRPASNTGADVTLRDASPVDRNALAQMAHAIFSGYVSHFHANPLFDRDKVLAGYAEWASRHAEGGDGSAAWIVERDGKPIGFSCYRIDRARAAALGVLNGIMPAARGRGAYRAMLGAMLNAFADMRMARFEIATQVHNVAVQRVWTSYGLALRSAVNTVHVNALRCRDGAARRDDAAVSPARAETR